MDDIKKVSELARANGIQDGDIMLISKRTSPNTLKSLGLDYANLVKSLRDSFRDELDTLNSINDTYVDDTTMKFTYDTTKHDLVLKTDASERRVNISKFIFSGMVKNVIYKKASHSLEITFNKADGSTVTVDVDISDVFIFNEGDGIEISEDKTISIDPNVVSKVGHKHVMSDITDYVAPEIPTKLSQLQNDSGFITGYVETDPTVPSWAKAETKPSYSASEVGAYTKAEVDGKIPTKTSQLTNDSGFLTSHQSLDGYVKNTEKVTLTFENEAGTKVTYEVYGRAVS
jgi:hypothetical protein